MDEDLLDDNSSSVGASLSSGIRGSFLLLWTDARHNRCLLQVRGFFSFGLTTDHSHAASVQRELVTPAFVSLAPPASSPSLDANGETDLHVFDASDCSTLQLLQLDRVQKGGGGSKEF